MMALWSRRLLMLLLVTRVMVDGGALLAGNSETLLNEIGLAELQAKAEEAVASELAERSAADLNGVESLYASGYASWREAIEARHDSFRAAERLGAIKRFREWLQRVRRASSEFGGTTNSSRPMIIHLDLSFPGSRGVLGWVRPERLNELDRDLLIQLLVQRSELAVGLVDEIDSVRYQAEYVAWRLERLRSQTPVSGAELKATQSHQNLLQTRLALAQAIHDRRKSEHGILVASIGDIHNIAMDPEHLDQRSRLHNNVLPGITTQYMQRHRERLVTILTYEANARGVLEQVQSARNLSDLVDRSRTINRGQFVGEAQSQLTEQGLAVRPIAGLKPRDPNHDDPSHQQHAGGDRNVGVVAHQVPFREESTSEPSIDRLFAYRSDRPLLRKAIEIAREWFEAISERDVAEHERSWRSEFVQRLQRQSQPSPNEILAAKYASDVCIGRVRAASERAFLVCMLFDQIPDVAEDESAIQLSLIGDEEAETLLSVAEQHVASFSHSRGQQRLAVQAAKVDGLRILQSAGHASADEMARAELTLNLVKCEQESARRRLRLAELDLEIMKSILALRNAHDLAHEGLHGVGKATGKED